LKNVLKILILTCLIMLSSFKLNGLAQSNIIGEESFVYPTGIPTGTFKNLVGLSLANLPEDVIETDDLFRAPLFSYSVKFGLPKNFLIDASVNTNFITFQFTLGGKWIYSIDKFSFAPGYDLAYFFGQLNHFGFNSKVNGWINYPNLTVGYAFNDFTLSVKGELILVTNINESEDDLELSRDDNFFSGYAITAAIEQPLWKENYILLGIKLNFAKFYYPQWAAFSTFNRLFFIPELMVGFIL